MVIFRSIPWLCKRSPEGIVHCKHHGFKFVLSRELIIQIRWIPMFVRTGALESAGVRAPVWLFGPKSQRILEAALTEWFIAMFGKYMSNIE